MTPFSNVRRISDGLRVVSRAGSVAHLRKSAWRTRRIKRSWPDSAEPFGRTQNHARARGRIGLTVNQDERARCAVILIRIKEQRLEVAMRTTPTSFIAKLEAGSVSSVATFTRCFTFSMRAGTTCEVCLIR